MGVHFDPVVLLTFAVLCLLGIVSNALAFCYVIKALKGVQKSLFFLLITDSITSLIGSDSMKLIVMRNFRRSNCSHTIWTFLCPVFNWHSQNGITNYQKLDI